jgi:hypothetical protein
VDGGKFVFSGAGTEVAYTPDAPEFRLSGSFSLSCWVYPRAFASPFATSPQAQIMFRGDDRGGLDPYQLIIARNGRFVFAIQSKDSICAVSGDARLNRWTHLLATLDAKNGKMRLYLNGKLAEETITSVRPLTELDARYHPGVSLGNTQFPQGGVHRQPFDGFIRDARIYDEVVDQGVAIH